MELDRIRYSSEAVHAPLLYLPHRFCGSLEDKPWDGWSILRVRNGSDEPATDIEYLLACSVHSNFMEVNGVSCPCRYLLASMEAL